MVANGPFNQPRGFLGGKAVLGLAHELRLSDEDRDHGTAARQHVIARDQLCLAVLHPLAIGADAFQDRRPEPGLMRAAFRRGDGVAVALQEAVARGCPVDRPFDRAGHVELFGKANLAGKGAVGIGRGLGQLVRQVIAKAPGKVKGRLLRGFAVTYGRFPADFDAREQIGLGSRHLQQAGGLELQAAEDFRIRVEGGRGAAPVGGRTGLGNRTQRNPAREFLNVQLLVARHLNPHPVRQGIDHRCTNAMQPARRLIGLAREFAARMQGTQDHLQRRFAGKPRMRVNRNPASVVADGQGMVHMQFHINAGGMPRHGLVHRIVQHLGGQMVQGALIGAADIHAGAFAHRFQPFQHFDGRCVIGLWRAREKIVGHVCSILGLL